MPSLAPSVSPLSGWQYHPLGFRALSEELPSISRCAASRFPFSSVSQDQSFLQSKSSLSSFIRLVLATQCMLLGAHILYLLPLPLIPKAARIVKTTTNSDQSPFHFVPAQLSDPGLHGLLSCTGWYYGGSPPCSDLIHHHLSSHP